MSSSSRHSVIFGLLITAVALLAQWVGLFENLERASIDLRSKYAWWTPRPMSSEICHVDIDDGAVESVGWWPWDRSKLADAIVELRRAGARTIALDIMFSEPQPPDWVEVPRDDLDRYAVGKLEVKCPGEGAAGGGTEAGPAPSPAPAPDGANASCFVLLDHDAVLAAALHVDRRETPGQCVLSVKPSDVLDLDPLWLTGRGPEERNRLIDVLGRNIRVEVGEAAQDADLRGARETLFKQTPNQFRALAAWRELAELDKQAVSRGEELTLDDFVREMTPGAPRNLGEFPERRILVLAWQQYEAWRAVRPHLIIGAASSTDRDVAPLPVLAREAASVGFVNRQEDVDGAVRSLKPLWPAPGGRAVQLGLMAAAHHLGFQLTDIEQLPGWLRVGSRRLSLRDGRLWLSWPRPLHRGDGPFGAFRRDDSESDRAGHVSIAVPVDIAKQRRIQDRNEREFARLTYKFATGRDEGAPSYDQLTPRMREDARSFVELGLPEDSQPAADTDDPETALLRYWVDLGRSIDNGREEITQAEAKLLKHVKDKLVFIGATFTGAAADFVPTPLGALTPGVMVHATVADMVLSSRSLKFAPPWSTYALTLLLGLGATIAASTLTPVKSTIFAVFLVMGYAALACFGLFATMDLVVAMTPPVSAGAGAWIACTVVEATLFQRDRLRITRQFKARVSGQLVDFLVENPNSVALTGEQREMTIMFTDLAGFTSISESLGGQATVATLNRYMSAMTRLLVAEGAYLNKFLGDGFMAFWSAFALDQDQAIRACRAALHCQDTVAHLNDDPQYRDIPKLSLRVGITTGRVVVGDCGAPPDLNDYTVIGDAVNLAARLESANKQFGTRILIDGRTRELLPANGLLLRPIGRVVALGQSVPIEIFEVMSPGTPPELIDLTTRAVESFRAADLSGSRALWERMAERFGRTKLGDLYLAAIAEADDKFDGVIRLQVK